MVCKDPNPCGCTEAFKVKLARLSLLDTGVITCVLADIKRAKQFLRPTKIQVTVLLVSFTDHFRLVITCTVVTHAHFITHNVGQVK